MNLIVSLDTGHTYATARNFRKSKSVQCVKEDVKNIFIQSCIRHRDSRKEDIELVKRRIYVVSFEYNNTYFLGLEKKE